MGSINGKKMLIIGGCGFIGLHLAKRLAGTGSDITIFCKTRIKAEKLDFADKINFIEGDISDYNSVEKNIKDKDIIVNLAAVIQDIGEFDPYPDLDVNCSGQINILEARKKVNINSKYIFIGTRAQFGKVKEEDLPVSE